MVCLVFDIGELASELRPFDWIVFGEIQVHPF